MKCTKAKYLSRKEARKAAKRKSRRVGKKLTAYKCQYCEGNTWHHTSADHVNRRTLREISAKEKTKLA